jgi:hypothetical protein
LARKFDISQKKSGGIPVGRHLLGEVGKGDGPCDQTSQIVSIEEWAMISGARRTTCGCAVVRNAGHSVARLAERARCRRLQHNDVCIARELLDGLPLSAEELVLGNSHVLNAGRYIDKGEFGAARFELCQLARHLLTRSKETERVDYPT